MVSAHATPASVLEHADSLSEAVPPQQRRGEHAVQAHSTDCVMLKPGSGGG